jgi:hypothetical protein
MKKGTAVLGADRPLHDWAHALLLDRQIDGWQIDRRSANPGWYVTVGGDTQGPMDRSAAQALLATYEPSQKAVIQACTTLLSGLDYERLVGMASVRQESRAA